MHGLIKMNVNKFINIICIEGCHISTNMKSHMSIELVFSKFMAALGWGSHFESNFFSFKVNNGEVINEGKSG